MNISIAILAGGMSRRFGADKTLALLEDRPLIQWVRDGAAQISTDVMVISKDPAKYMFLENVRQITDPEEQQCPMVGIITALEHAAHENVFVISADAPLFPFEALKELVLIDKADAVVPEIAGKLYPCAALYRKSALEALKKHYEQQDFRLTNVFNTLSVVYPDEKLFSKYTDTATAFTNINTQTDLQKLRDIRIKKQKIEG